MITKIKKVPLLLVIVVSALMTSCGLNKNEKKQIIIIGSQHDSGYAERYLNANERVLNASIDLETREQIIYEFREFLDSILSEEAAVVTIEENQQVVQMIRNHLNKAPDLMFAVEFAPEHIEGHFKDADFFYSNMPDYFDDLGIKNPKGKVDKLSVLFFGPVAYLYAAKEIEFNRVVGVDSIKLREAASQIGHERDFYFNLLPSGEPNLTAFYNFLEILQSLGKMPSPSIMDSILEDFTSANHLSDDEVPPLREHIQKLFEIVNRHYEVSKIKRDKHMADKIKNINGDVFVSVGSFHVKGISENLRKDGLEVVHQILSPRVLELYEGKY